MHIGHFAIFFLAAAAPLAAKLPSVRPPQSTIDNGCVTRFYGVPLKLSFADLDTLKLDHTIGFVSGEGNFYPSATLLVGGNVLLQAEFSRDKEQKLYKLTTSSPGAVGPGGVAIGATLDEVQKRWPKGDFYWTAAHGEYVAFSTGTDVYFEFNPSDMPPEAFANPPVPIQDASGKWVSPPRKKVVPDPTKLKVRSIRITPGKFSESCKTSNGNN